MKAYRDSMLNVEKEKLIDPLCLLRTIGCGQAWAAAAERQFRKPHSLTVGGISRPALPREIRGARLSCRKFTRRWMIFTYCRTAHPPFSQALVAGAKSAH
jgi:hypothetical protein